MNDSPHLTTWLMNMRPAFYRNLAILFITGMFLSLASIQIGYAQTTENGDPEDVATDEEERSNLPDGHSPEGALWRSIAVPGWGQYYNREILKIPVVYAGLAGIASFTVLANDRYYLFRNVYRYAQEPEEFSQYEELAQPFMEEIQSGRTERLRRERERYRRYRDLSIVGFFAFYAFSVLDAYVSAHLLHFDVDEDLSFRLHGDQRGPGATLSWQF